MFRPHLLAIFRELPEGGQELIPKHVGAIICKQKERKKLALSIIHVS